MDSNQPNLTGREILDRTAKIEEAAALELGRILFEFSRLEFSIGMCIAWSRADQDIEQAAKLAEGLPLDKRIHRIAKRAKELSSPEGADAYKAWAKRMRVAQRVRNTLVHGRWGIEAATMEIVNVTDLPASGNQRERRYTVPALAEYRAELTAIGSELSLLCDRWPLRGAG